MTRREVWSAALAAAMVAAVGGGAWAQGGPGGPGGPRPGGFGGPGGFRGGFGLMGLLRMPEVQRELKLQQAQVELLEAMGPRPGGPGGPGGFGGPRPGGPGGPGGQGGPGGFNPEEFQKRMAAMRAEQEKQIGEVLDAKQMARLKQLELQQGGIRSIDRKEVADALKLTPEQRQRVQTAIQAERDVMRQAFTGFQPGEPPSEEQRRAAFQKMQDARAATDAKLSAVLTPAQKTQFTQMQGTPFKFPERRFGPGGPGGPGGFGGQRPPRDQ